MSALRARLYGWARGRRDALGPVQVSTPELLYYLWKRGGRAWLRGLVHRHRFGRCGRRLLIGKRVEILFPRHVRLGDNVHIGHDTYLNGLSRDGIQIGDGVRLREHVWIQATSRLD